MLDCHLLPEQLVDLTLLFELHADALDFTLDVLEFLLQNSLFFVTLLEFTQHLEVFLRQLLDLILVAASHGHHLLLNAAKLVLQNAGHIFLLLITAHEGAILLLESLVLLFLDVDIALQFTIHSNILLQFLFIFVQLLLACGQLFLEIVEGLVFRIVLFACTFFVFAHLRELDDVWIQAVGVGDARDSRAVPVILNCLAAADADVVDG